MNTISTRFFPFYVSATCLVLTTLALTGCQGKDKEPITPLGDTTPTPPAETGDSDSLPGFDAEKLFFEKVGSLSPIYFGFDSSALDSAALADVRAASELFKTDPTAIIQVEGHCDERGTQEYNLALGERRAQSVRDQLRQLGVSGDRIVTISYGEESPAVPGSHEGAWAKNRRCEFSKARTQ